MKERAADWATKKRNRVVVALNGQNAWRIPQKLINIITNAVEGFCVLP
jgi:hypothetical protein